MLKYLIKIASLGLLFGAGASQAYEYTQDGVLTSYHLQGGTVWVDGPLLQEGSTICPGKDNYHIILSGPNATPDAEDLKSVLLTAYVTQAKLKLAVEGCNANYPKIIGAKFAR